VNDLSKIALCVDETRQQVMDWAASNRNNGPFSEEAYRVCVHIGAALDILADKIRSEVR
jgi:hypothetical protein